MGYTTDEYTPDIKRRKMVGEVVPVEHAYVDCGIMRCINGIVGAEAALKENVHYLMLTEHKDVVESIGFLGKLGVNIGESIRAYTALQPEEARRLHGGRMEDVRTEGPRATSLIEIVRDGTVIQSYMSTDRDTIIEEARKLLDFTR